MLIKKPRRGFLCLRIFTRIFDGVVTAADTNDVRRRRVSAAADASRKGEINNNYDDYC